jgi:hypothetical protein
MVVFEKAALLLGFNALHTGRNLKVVYEVRCVPIFTAFQPEVGGGNCLRNTGKYLINFMELELKTTSIEQSSNSRSVDKLFPSYSNQNLITLITKA